MDAKGTLSKEDEDLLLALILRHGGFTWRHFPQIALVSRYALAPPPRGAVSFPFSLPLSHSLSLLSSLSFSLSSSSSSRSCPPLPGRSVVSRSSSPEGQRVRSHQSKDP
jgi:hypothetical protein